MLLMCVSCDALNMTGFDVALVRATIVDADNNVCEDATVTISFRVSSGPGLVWGTASGNPTDQEPARSSRTTYHGLVRSVVRVTLDASGSTSDRSMLAYVNPDAGAGPRSSSIWQGSSHPPTSLVVEAVAEGLPLASLSLSLSTDPADAVLEVAAASIASADTGE